MATELIDLIDNLADDNKLIHNIENVGNQTCRGGINLKNVVKLVSDYSPKYFNNSYLASLPAGFKQFNMQKADQCIEHLRLKYKKAN